MSFSVLFVCAGNVCRSPFAERLLRWRLRERGVGDIDVASAGVRALEGHSMNGQSAADLARLGGDSEGFTARRLTESLVVSSSLVLTATRGIRSTVLEIEPSGLRRTFTISEFAALAPRLDANQSLSALVRQCSGRRSDVADLDLDVPDPIGQDQSVFAAVAARLDREVTAIADVLAR